MVLRICQNLSRGLKKEEKPFHSENIKHLRKVERWKDDSNSAKASSTHLFTTIFKRFGTYITESSQNVFYLRLNEKGHTQAPFLHAKSCLIRP